MLLEPQQPIESTQEQEGFNNPYPDIALPLEQDHQKRCPTGYDSVILYCHVQRETESERERERERGGEGEHA